MELLIHYSITINPNLGNCSFNHLKKEKYLKIYIILFNIHVILYINIFSNRPQKETCSVSNEWTRVCLCKRNNIGDN